MQRLFGVAVRRACSAAWEVTACEAPGFASAEGVTVAVRGQPYWRGGTEFPADARIAEEILRAYQREGPCLLDRLHGGFSLAIVDAAAGRTILTVDRMGIGRLAYTVSQDRLVFSSSSEAVARELSAKPSIDRQSILSYLVFHMIPSPATIFAGVQKLPPASVAVFENDRLNVRRYWQPSFAEDGRVDFNSLKRDLHGGLREAVLCAAPSDQSGAFLSGGLDSSSIAGFMSEVAPAPARTFSIGFGFDGYDELKFARIANRHFGCLGHEYSITASDIVGAFSAIARAYDEPFGNSSALPAYYCAQIAMQHGVTHLLAGDGGDELFAGNSRYAKQLRLERYQRLPHALRHAVIEPLLDALPDTPPVALLRKARAYSSRARIPLPDRLELWNPFWITGLTDALDPDFMNAIDRDAPLALMRSVYTEAPARSSLNRLLYYDWRFTLADNDLRKVESMCDFAGVRVSYPMLHPAVVDLANRVPPQTMMPGTRLRDFYKRAMADFLPTEIIHKRKHGFGLPFGLWLKQSESLHCLILDNLNRLRGRGIIRGDFIDKLRTLHDEHDAEYFGSLVWVLAMLEQWFQEHEISL